ncbi:hypothetical protein [Nocardioides sp.]|uniref:hypothetical protein n=1 Tax=Nocardioides sp. TaxID=35761 RepID=UPI002C39C45F|nr:hypothetical protein [Nocardioides sp.]HXH80040.1 hypothetical protein [Nocardioides sp.]
MTTERFKDHLDRLDTGLPDHPDTAEYMREGRAARRRRHSIIGLGAGALVAAVITPVLVWGGSTSTVNPTGEVASDPSSSASSEPTPTPTPTPTPEPAPVGPVDRSFGDGMTAAVTEVVPRAELLDETVGDHFEDAKDGNFHFRNPTLSSPPDWANVFIWAQEYAADGLQYLYVRAEWDTIAAEQMSGCDDGMYEVMKDCSVVESDGYTVVVHDGARFPGEPVGNWGRSVTVTGPPSADGSSQYVKASAQVKDMSWEEASAALPSVADLTALAQDERLRLPEPTEMPTP